MDFIQLDRRFIEWSEGDIEGFRFRSEWGLSDDLLGWSELLARRRVVLLAEAGSGKTTELNEQARLLLDSGKASFYATVQDVGRNGLDAALRLKDRTRLKAWRRGTGSAWFFIDSIDEAKLDNIRLEQALRRVADAITGCEARAHILLSGRHTDWEFKRDARRFGEELPIPETHEDTPPLETLVRRLLHMESIPDPEPSEVSLIVVMAPLNDRQVRAYATGKGAPNVDDLVEAIDKGNLQDLARRPLDLDWIVRLWMTRGQLGNFTEMIEASLQERLSEADPVRARRDGLEATRAMSGLERVGAALVFGRRATIGIPDGDEPSRDEGSLLTLDSVLSDWTGTDRTLLLNRPAFDPATYGRARLHNDNEGVVRAFLAARWLHRLLRANLPSRRLRDLLFARKYEIDLVRPSMLECAAWISGWDERVAAEVVRRAPHLLFTAGDPSSLEPSTRRAALRALAERLSKDEELPSLDFSSVKRFAQPDIAPPLSELWQSHKDHEEIRTLLLRLVWAGELGDCADIAVEASFGRYPDLYTAVLAGRALVATASEPVRRDYADYVKKHCSEISSTELWEAVDSLFPSDIGVNELLAIVDDAPLSSEGNGSLDLEWKGKEWVRRLTDAADLTRLVEGFLRQLESAQSESASPDRPRRSERFVAALAAGAKYLIEMSPANQAPQTAVDAVLRLGQRRLERSEPDGEDLAAAIDLLHRTAERRRVVFWRAASTLSTHPSLTGRSLDQVHQMRYLGWPPGLIEEDVDWLLADGAVRKEPNERRLAMNAALHIWWNLERPESLRARIAKGAGADAEMQAAFSEGTQPYVKSEREIQMDQQFAQQIEEGKRAQQEQVQSWIAFIQNMRANPDQLRHPSVTEAGVDRRIYDLWQLLNQANRKSSRHAISSLAPIVEIAGQEVAEAFAAGLSLVWRTWCPTLRSKKEPDKRDWGSLVDLLGLAGVSIEAANRPDWALQLTADDAIRAAQYATLEINGFPDWLSALSAAWPDQVSRVLAQEVQSDLDDPTPRSHYQSLDDIGRASDALSHSMAPTLWHELQGRTSVSHLALRRMLPALVAGLPAVQREAFRDLVIERFRSSADPQVAADYLGAAYALDVHGATDALVRKLDALKDVDKKALVERVLPQIFGSRWYLSAPQQAITLDIQTLERLVVLAYREVRVADDRNRTSQEAYSPDERDVAEDARSAAFNALLNTPGPEAFAAIMRLAETLDFPVSRSQLRALAHGRAATDSERLAWSPGEPMRFEQEFERPPSTGADLQLVAVGRLEDLQDDLVDGDFQQGSTLSTLPDESAVQNWLADRLRQVQGTAYSIEREVHVADEKEPDIRFRAKASDASVAMEVKVAGSWTIKQLEAALEVQLCGQYLRARDGREGILLLVHQTPKRWKLHDGRYLTFDSLIDRLRQQAKSIRERSPTGPQPEVCVIDVSSCDRSKGPKGKPTKSPKKKPANRSRPQTSGASSRGRGLSRA